jgi:hypothetical protein
VVRWTVTPCTTRAVGPMQFIASTWRRVQVDGNGDGRGDPDNIYDAALGAAVYLCAGETDLRDRRTADGGEVPWGDNPAPRAGLRRHAPTPGILPSGGRLCNPGPFDGPVGPTVGTDGLWSLGGRASTVI